MKKRRTQNGKSEMPQGCAPFDFCPFRLHGKIHAVRPMRWKRRPKTGWTGSKYENLEGNLSVPPDDFQSGEKGSARPV